VGAEDVHKSSRQSEKVQALNTQSTIPAPSIEPLEDSRRRRLVEVTLDSLAELGYVGTTLRADRSPSRRVAGAGGSLFQRQGRSARGGFSLAGAACGQSCAGPPAANQYPPRARIQRSSTPICRRKNSRRKPGRRGLHSGGRCCMSRASNGFPIGLFSAATLTNLRIALKQLVAPYEAQSWLP